MHAYLATLSFSLPSLYLQFSSYNLVYFNTSIKELNMIVSLIWLNNIEHISYYFNTSIKAL